MYYTTCSVLFPQQCLHEYCLDCEIIYTLDCEVIYIYGEVTKKFVYFINMFLSAHSWYKTIMYVWKSSNDRVFVYIYISHIDQYICIYLSE